MLAQLIPTTGGKPVTLTKDITVVGRSAKLCDLVVEHTSISKMHCILVKTDGLLYMRDLGSTNGTRVNGQRVLRGALLPGDQLSFAGMSYKVYLGPDRPTSGVSTDSRTEMMPVITDESSTEGFLPGKKTIRKGGSRKARSLGDSDLLPPD